ncbi:immunoglobulin-binding protein 1 isoform X1 [Ammospiza nelsoni]|uniref:immunoglobulin-binding protein 1 isoform X1 n=1 Tax=Ammospiza nelsoni TaxID=2857394 RepID=UPI002869B83E|nr:immunoglobulin-binding protein 1 isoform X1 [Ammospiza nelsoni]
MMAEAGADGPRLAELLALGRRLWEELEASTEPSSGAPAVQDKVRQGLDALKRAAAMVTQLELFSENEELEEVASADLKFMLLPALLGALTLKQVDLSKRREHLESAREHFLHFLKLCRNYGLCSFQLPSSTSSEDESRSSPAPQDPGQSTLLAMAKSRSAKIERYKQKKELENKLASMSSSVESGTADEDQIREFYILQIQKWIGTSLEEMESIEQELVILKSRDAARQSPAGSRGSPRPARTPVKPFILTRDAAQARVFGAGYPGLPTMTVDDWYEQRRKQGIVSTPQRVPGTSDEEMQKQQKETEEEEEEEDDEEALRKARDWDDWKDTHPRGYGNRHNMG